MPAIVRGFLVVKVTKAAGVDQLKTLFVIEGFCADAVTGHTDFFVHNRNASPDNTIEGQIFLHWVGRDGDNSFGFL